MQPLSTLVNIYGLLLQIPANEEWRIRNSMVYATVRDSIADMTGVDPENVQNFCEAVAASARGA